MTYMMKAFPDRAFDVGIAEGHSVTFSAGLAKEGMNLSATCIPRLCSVRMIWLSMM